MTIFEKLYLGRSPHLIILDLDGTLIDSAPDLAKAANIMLERLNREFVSIEQVRQWVGDGAYMLVTRLLARRLEVHELERKEAEVHSTALNYFLAAYGECCAEETVLYPGVFESLNEWCAKEIRLACVTNKPIQHTETLLNKFKLRDLMSTVIGGDSLPAKKPDPLPLMYAMEKNVVDKNHTLKIGDSKTDVLSARSAQIPIVCVSYGYNHGNRIEDENPDFVVNSLLEIR